MLLFSIYAPLAEHDLEVERSQFATSFIEFTHQLDLQIPTLLLGDFNGSFCPSRDFLNSARQRPPCPLLSHLLGPGGAWIDTHATLTEPPLAWTFRMEDTSGLRAASRIDLILANQAALPLLHSVEVLSSVRDGGHSPVIVTLSLDQSLSIAWRRPLPKPPALLLRSSTDLRTSPDWQVLLDAWSSSTPGQIALDPSIPYTLHSLSAAMLAALQHLVALAGEWTSRPPSAPARL